MPLTNLPLEPKEATKNLLKKLPTRRMRDVLEKRFGLKGGRRRTLEAVGKDYKITRERVRQIEVDALKHLRKESEADEFIPLYQTLEGHIKEYGGVMAEDHLFTTLAAERSQRNLVLLLGAAGPFTYIKEDGAYRARWAVDQEAVAQAERIVSRVKDQLAETKSPVTRSALLVFFEEAARSVLGESPGEQVYEALLATSKLIRKNPYGDYGLDHWVMIQPRGVRDKAYVALAKAGKPLHFLDVTSAINSAAWSRSKAHPQTVHNELIKDPRFVLVGRGLYALGEWGYTPGVVRDVLVSVLKEAGKPMPRDEIVKTVLEKRMIKPPTVLLNLQNRSLFRKLDDGRFTLV